ncbi:SDR family oxidoreductase [Sphingopyxis indica]|uniref:SDR family NAD(P)-dependent oxidoreductase n=1 Tax=Sphingopyxis indica TaxID=436663 RepID=UPI0029390F0E|nr:SDR family oxidoreductase [Sphingopyxis indica]WOF42989.1 SDR family oxidoreductase [Sphingopyxis indica]
MVIVGGFGAIGYRLSDVALGLGLQVAALDLATSIASKPHLPGMHAGAIDATDEGSVQEAFRAIDTLFDGIDVLVNLVGFRNRLAPVDEIGLEEWDEIIGGNLRSAILITRAALPLLTKAGGGAIVHVASAMGLRPVPQHAPYAVSKAALLMLAQATAIEVAPSIRVNAVAPSAVDTPFHQGGTGRSTYEDSAADPEIFKQGVPMGRIARVDDVVGPILFLAGPHAGFMTGQTLLVTGGK